MSDLADLFPGFATHWIDIDSGRFFVRSHGEGPPLLLLHGYPQTHVEWHKVAPALAERFTVVLMDMRGYGWSSAPASKKGALYTKRLMAQDAIAVMEQLGHIRFSLVGHDRGGRVGYRLALDHPERLEKLALIDIIPTAARWASLNAAEALKGYHWLFLAQPEPFPETLIGGAANYYVDHTLASWTLGKSLAAFDPRALAHYRAALNEPSRIHATCEDYRAGASLDRADDEADQAAGRKITTPLCVLWGGRGLGGGDASTLDIWGQWATNVTGQAIHGGHFLPEENPQTTLEALLAFL
ncbi:alpha/beta fold hydrolase [Methylocella silvestris]|uniref:Alpha/beta hydrolase n=1 Tax=Methylocella silvestris TaxID=199596 RepID=A0A2J7TL15_METSI|nr:alpha/beta hydrolase [Methylocella silvestris]PNG27451.1 alpha/beta hydrolase [Methylocella silvestris]